MYIMYVNMYVLRIIIYIQYVTYLYIMQNIIQMQFDCIS